MTGRCEPFASDATEQTSQRGPEQVGGTTWWGTGRLHMAAAAGLGTFVVGLLLLVLFPPAGIVVLLLALAVNAVMPVGAATAVVVGIRRRGALGCSGCGHMWNPRPDGTQDVPPRLPSGRDRTASAWPVP